MWSARRCPCRPRPSGRWVEGRGSTPAVEVVRGDVLLDDHGQQPMQGSRSERIPKSSAKIGGALTGHFRISRWAGVVGAADQGTRPQGSVKLPSVTPDEQRRRERAVQRAKVMVLHKGRVGEPEVDFTPVSGAAAISLATRLTVETFSLARLDGVRTPRAEMPIRFVSRTRV